MATQGLRPQLGASCQIFVHDRFQKAAGWLVAWVTHDGVPGIIGKGDFSTVVQVSIAETKARGSKSLTWRHRRISRYQLATPRTSCDT